MYITSSFLFYSGKTKQSQFLIHYSLTHEADATDIGVFGIPT